VNNLDPITSNIPNFYLTLYEEANFTQTSTQNQESDDPENPQKIFLMDTSVGFSLNILIAHLTLYEDATTYHNTNIDDIRLTT
jgi:hypothetical protein